MNKLDRLAALAHRQLVGPVRDFAFVGAMIAMTALSFGAVTAAASPLIAKANIDPTVIADPANDNEPCDLAVVRPVRG
jgi:hypothetical protein